MNKYYVSIAISVFVLLQVLFAACYLSFQAGRHVRFTAPAFGMNR